MIQRILNFATIPIILCGIFTSSLAYGQYTGLVSKIPHGANTVIIVDVEALHNSPLGKKDNWREKHLKAVEAGVAAVPSQATKYVSAAKLDFDSMEPEWEVALMYLNSEPSMAKVAHRYQGSVDNIKGREVAVLPGDMYVVKFGPNIAGVGSPARRQDVSRWLNRIYSNSLPGLSPYLAEAQKFVEKNSSIIMAIDLTDAVPASVVRKRLEESETLRGKNLDLDEASKSLASIRGVTLGITVSESRIGAIKVDFSEDISSFKEFAKPMLLEALANNGVMIDEFREWDVRSSDKRIQIQGELTQSGMRRILSLLETPPSLQEAAKQTSQNDPETQRQKKLLASQQYFKSVESLIDDLRGQKAGRKTMGQIGVWFGKYARRIDRLSMIDVDPDLQQYGKFVADSLRQGQGQVHEAAAQSRIRVGQVPEQYDVQTWSVPIGANWAGSYSWGGWTATPNRTRTGQLRSRARTQERIRGNMSANLILQHVDEATGDIRRHMAQKYNANF